MHGRSDPKAAEEERIIANLMASDIAAPSFAALDSERHRRCRERLANVCALWDAQAGISFESTFADELEELETEVSGVVLEALLERLEGVRADLLRTRGDAARPDRFASARPSLGRFLIHRFGDSLETGEAEIAARGFFDVWDRPPVCLWLEALSRPMPRREGAFEVSVLVFVPQEQVVAAEAGRAACGSGALFFLDEVEGELKSQLTPLLAQDVDV